MYDYIKGKLAYKNDAGDTTITLDANGIGYLIFINSGQCIKMQIKDLKIIKALINIMMLICLHLI